MHHFQCLSIAIASLHKDIRSSVSAISNIAYVLYKTHNHSIISPLTLYNDQRKIDKTCYTYL